MHYQDSLKYLHDIQNRLNDSIALISYFEGKQTIFQFTVLKDTIYNQAFPRYRGYKDSILSFRTNCIDFQKFLRTPEKSYAHFCNQAFNLYKNNVHLQLPKNIKDLVIIPDGWLKHLPFNALLFEQALNSKIDFKQLPYLIKKYSINQNYTISQWYTDHQKEQSQEIEFLGLTTQTQLAGRTTIHFLEQHYEGIYYKDNYASSKYFRYYLPYQKALHLALDIHFKTNQIEESYFKFSTDSLELINLQGLSFRSLLTILDGSIEQDTLVDYSSFFELLQGLHYAGNQSIIYRSWSAINGFPSSILMNFYQHLESGKHKARSLQEAQLEYLKFAPSLTAHPAFWAAYQQWGDTVNLQPLSPTTKIWWYILPIASIFLLGWWGLRGLKQKQKF